jgi:arylformamidase
MRAPHSCTRHLTPLLLLALIPSAWSAARAPSFVDIPYGEHERHRLDLWQAKSDMPTPLLIFIHGGGWHGGSKSDLPIKLLEFMLKQGVSVASINYRHTSTARLPAPVHDAARSVQFLRSRATAWNLNPKRFGAYGVSAGATTALWLAYHDDLAVTDDADPIKRHSTRLQVAVGLSPQTCLEPKIITSWIGKEVLNHPMIARAVGAGKVQDLANPQPAWIPVLREFSPINHVSPGDPPVLISNPRVDPLPATNPGSAIHHAIFGVKLKQKADRAGVPCILRIETTADASIAKPETFLRRYLTAN